MGLKFANWNEPNSGVAIEGNYTRSPLWDKMVIKSMFVYPSSRRLAIWSIDNVVSRLFCNIKLPL